MENSSNLQCFECAHPLEKKTDFCPECGEGLHLEIFEIKDGKGNARILFKSKEVKEGLKSGELTLFMTSRRVWVYVTGKDVSGNLIYEVDATKKSSPWKPMHDTCSGEIDVQFLYDPPGALCLAFALLFAFLGFAGYGAYKLMPYIQSLGASPVASGFWSFFVVVFFLTVVVYAILTLAMWFFYRFDSFLALTWETTKALGWGVAGGLVGLLVGAITGYTIGCFIKPKVTDPNYSCSLLAKLKYSWKESSEEVSKKDKDK